MTLETNVIELELLKGDEKIIAEAKQRFEACETWESDSRSKFVADIKFAHADPDNGWQWPGYLWSQRQDDPRGYKPRLTINKVRQHNLQIKNNVKKNPPGIKISPVGDKATFKAAQAWLGLVRHIERSSKAIQAYTTANGHQVDGGIGYIRLATEYVDDDSFDQELRILRVKNPLNVYMDPDAQEIDKSDSRFAFYFEDMPVDEFLREYPNMRGHISESLALSTEMQGWLSKDHVRVAEYFARTMKKDRLVLMQHPETGEKIVARWSRVPPEIKKQIEENDSIIKEREILEHEIKHYKIAGDKILEKKKWPGRFIPIVPVVGEEEIVEGRLDRKGHTRNLKDAQRMYNFWTSSAVEQVALQTKTRWFVPVGATENLINYYSTINTSNYPFIPYNALDMEGRPLPPPTPIDPPQMADGFIKGMMVAKDEFAMTSGQRDETMGQETNAISFKAINARQMPGETATYHFIDGLAIAIAQVANIILDVAPHIYDTKQIKRIIDPTGKESLIQIDPQADQAYTENEDTKEGEVVAIFNPTVGKYWVAPDIGPGYQTKRQEAWDAFVNITTQNRELVGLVGDLMFQYADFPGADEISERLRRMVPPAALGEGPSLDLQKAMQANDQLNKLVVELTDKLAGQSLEMKDKSDRNETERMRAENDRLKQVDNASGSIDPNELRTLVSQLVKEMMNPQNNPSVTDAGEDSEPEGTPPIPGARLAPDNQWYVQDATGQHHRVDRVNG